jgi:aminopeptidase-like protein
MRKGWWDYPEYHTSLDNKDLISFETMEESVDTLVEIVKTADRGTETYKCSVQYGSPMFAKCEEDIYKSTMELNNFNRGESHRRMLLELCNYSDGYLSLLEIAERNRRKVVDYIPLVDRLVRLGYLVKVRSI